LWKGLALQLPEQMMKAQMAKHTMVFLIPTVAQAHSLFNACHFFLATKQ